MFYVLMCFALCLFISVLSGQGLAILLVEKGNDWPIKLWRVRIQVALKKIHWKLPQMLYCTTCTSFWTTLVTDIVLCAISIFLGGFYFFWPLSGIISSGYMWLIIETLNSIDKNKDINVFIDKGD